MRKNFPALSIEDSLDSSHRSGGGRRKFEGGGPDGVAYVLTVWGRRIARAHGNGRGEARSVEGRASAMRVNDFVAILKAIVMVRGRERCVW